jgi:hypothetical protein
MLLSLLILPGCGQEAGEWQGMELDPVRPTLTPSSDDCVKPGTFLPD